MRLHLPASPREHAFPQGLALVSTTDLKGHILHCHPAFIEHSGYAQEELLRQTAAAMKEITGTVRSSTGNAHQPSTVANNLGAVSTRSAQVVHRVTGTMSANSCSPHRMGEIMQVIGGLAFQANILALNAAVQSARAGAQGRGFAGVASARRALAQHRSRAAREIKPLINESADTDSAGERQTRKAQERIDETQKSVQDFGRLIANMPLSADEQLSGISQVNKAIKKMEPITQQNAAMVDEVQASLQIFRLSRKDGMERLLDARTLRRLAKAQRNAL